MSLSGDQSEGRLPVLKSPSKLGTHLSSHCSSDERLSRSCQPKNKDKSLKYCSNAFNPKEAEFQEYNVLITPRSFPVRRTISHMVTTNRLISRISLSDQILDRKEVAVVAEWYRYRIMACLVNGSSPVPLKTRRVGHDAR
ncbi:hypothetical protein TNCV_1719221 [Trichonephila clavipes]|nr:hypothetical protein TNCV_1719221 [Trichonephila clavipes]